MTLEDYQREQEIERAEREIEDAQALLAQHDDDRARRCPVCGDPLGIRCCIYGRDR